MEGDTAAGNEDRASDSPGRDRSTDTTGEPDTGRNPGEDTSPETGAQDSAAPVCDLCGAAMIEHHCKIVCPNCGYVRDCSDP